MRKSHDYKYKFIYLNQAVGEISARRLILKVDFHLFRIVTSPVVCKWYGISTAEEIDDPDLIIESLIPEGTRKTGS